jgi:hypothetical protein
MCEAQSDSAAERMGNKMEPLRLSLEDARQ